MIPEAAVEAAFQSMYAPGPSNPLSEDDAFLLRQLRAALEAAAPHMRQSFYLEMNLRAVQDELRATPIYPLGKIEDKRT